MKFELALEELRKGKEIRSYNTSLKHYGSTIKCNDFIRYPSDFVNEILKGDWQVIAEPGKTFPEVFEALKEGNKIRRKSWSKNLCLNVKISPIIGVDDVVATDWEIIE